MTTYRRYRRRYVVAASIALLLGMTMSGLPVAALCGAAYLLYEGQAGWAVACVLASALYRVTFRSWAEPLIDVLQGWVDR